MLLKIIGNLKLMGEVIDFEGFKKKKEDGDGEKASGNAGSGFKRTGPTMPTEATNERLDFYEGLDVGLFEQMYAYLLSLQQSGVACSSQDIELARKVFSLKSEAELLDVVNNSNTAAWEKHQSNYLGLIYVMHEKGMIPRLYLS